MGKDKISHETLYAYALFLRVGLMNFLEYRAWLDSAFLDNAEEQSELLIDLEYATNSINNTVHILDSYLSDNISDIDYDLLGKIITTHIENLYMQSIYSVEELAHKIYGMWDYFPYDIAMQQPFHIMSYIDDPLSYGDRAQTIDLIERFIDFYQ